MNLFLTLGVAGAGKSTFVNAMLETHRKPLQLLCLDDIRLALGDIYNIRTEPVVRMITDIMGRTFMERGLPIIIDSTCTSKYIAEKWIELAKEYNYKVNAYYLDTPFEVCCERRLNTLTNKIDFEVLERQREQLDELLEDTSMFDYIHTIKYKGE
jgi:predicted kinase